MIGLCGEVAVGAEVLEGGVALQDAGYLVLEDKEGAVALLHGWYKVKFTGNIWLNL